MQSSNKSPLVVYTIVDAAGGRSIWVRIGVAFINADGSLNARLDAVPTNGTLHIREHRALTEREPAAMAG